MTAPLTDWDAPELNEAAMTKPIDVDNDNEEGEADPEHAKATAPDQRRGKTPEQ